MTQNVNIEIPAFIAGPVRTMAEQHLPAMIEALSDSKFAAVYNALVNEVSNGGPKAAESQALLSIVWMSGPDFARSQLAVFKTRKAAARKSKDPAARTWERAFHDEILDLIQNTVVAAIPGIRDRIVSKDIPNSGAPEVLATLEGDDLIMAVFNGSKSHTTLRTGTVDGLKLPAVNPITGEIRQKGKDGSALSKAIVFGWRSDACRKVAKTKAKTEKADESAPETSEAPALPEGV